MHESRQEPEIRNVEHPPMLSFCQHPLRVSGRLFWLTGEILLTFLDFLINVVFQRKVPLTRARAQWLQQVCRRVLRILEVKIETDGPIPTNGLLVCNHLSGLEILVISATTPAVFISKSEIKRWPVFGWF